MAMTERPIWAPEVRNEELGLVNDVICVVASHQTGGEDVET